MMDNWQPGVSLEVLKQRARMLQRLREFMVGQDIMEVETPILCHVAVSDPQIESFATIFHHPAAACEEKLFLHTSPEYAMKRLLAAGSGPIYQITRVFRDGEAGRYHNPEFTMLEWYQPGFNHHALMDQLNELLQFLDFPPAEKKSYAALFENATGIDPHIAEIADLRDMAKGCGLISVTDDRPELLDYIYSHVVVPHLGRNRPLFVHDYPACQCALARLTQTEPPLAERFELFIHGLEIANGYHELCDASEQRQRFEKDRERRMKSGKPVHPLDENLLAALTTGLPPCAGVSVGVDRLLMVMHGIDSISDVIAFPAARA